MRVIFFLSAIIIAAAINVEYCHKRETAILIIAIMAVGWDVLDYFIKKP